LKQAQKYELTQTKINESLFRQQRFFGKELGEAYPLFSNWIFLFCCPSGLRKFNISISSIHLEYLGDEDSAQKVCLILWEKIHHSSNQGLNLFN
jgi:hypothetical protein